MSTIKLISLLVLVKIIRKEDVCKVGGTRSLISQVVVSYLTFLSIEISQIRSCIIGFPLVKIFIIFFTICPYGKLVPSV